MDSIVSNSASARPKGASGLAKAVGYVLDHGAMVWHSVNGNDLVPLEGCRDPSPERVIVASGKVESVGAIQPPLGPAMSGPSGYHGVTSSSRRVSCQS